jgi:hypothetical protein
MDGSPVQLYHYGTVQQLTLLILIQTNLKGDGFFNDLNVPPTVTHPLTRGVSMTGTNGRWARLK